jgi:hypothetical protein
MSIVNVTQAFWVCQKRVMTAFLFQAADSCPLNSRRDNF